MPKEAIHVLVARRTAELLRGSGLETPLARHEDALLAGCVLHDVLYYLRRDPAGGRIGALADRLHGADGGDTFELPRLVLARAGRPPSGPHAALFVGLVTHIFADAAFHPFVYARSGDYHHPDPAARSRAVRAHRALECLLDMAACGGMPGAESDLGPALRSAGPRLAGLLPMDELAHMAGVPRAVLGTALEQALDTFRRMHRLTRVRWLGQALFALRRALPAQVREVAALFFVPGLAAGADRLAAPVPYAHPATGEQAVFVLDQAMDQAARAAAKLCLRAAEQGPQALDPSEAPSLESGGPVLDAARPTLFPDPPWVQY